MLYWLLRYFFQNFSKLEILLRNRYQILSVLKYCLLIIISRSLKNQVVAIEF